MGTSAVCAVRGAAVVLAITGVLVMTGAAMVDEFGRGNLPLSSLIGQSLVVASFFKFCAVLGGRVDEVCGSVCSQLLLGCKIQESADEPNGLDTIEAQEGLSKLDWNEGWFAHSEGRSQW